MAALFDRISHLPYLDAVVREALRLYAPITTTMRVATQDDVIPTATPVKLRTKYGDVEEANSFVMRCASAGGMSNETIHPKTAFDERAEDAPTCMAGESGG